jgi:hypothetical protein
MWSRPITEVRNFRQALASPHLGSLAGRSRSGRDQLPAAPRSCWKDGEMKNATRFLSIAVLSALAISGCAARSVRIAELKGQPDKYDEKTVSVTGVVTNSYGISLVPFQLYSVDDGSGEITVVSRSGRSPSRGSRVEVKGKVDEIGVFGGKSIGLHLQENSRKTRR